MPLRERIEVSWQLARWLHERTDGQQFMADRRNQTALAILQLTMDISDGIATLLESKLPGPAFSLARAQLEGYVRGKWLLDWASDEQVHAFSEGRCPTFRKLLAQVPKSPESGGAWIHANAQANLNVFHDLTHASVVSHK